jgi:hypothetical protein
MVSTTYYAPYTETNNQSCHKGSYNTQPMSKDIVLDAHIRVLKKVIKVNGETMEVDIINMFGFNLMDIIFEWGENYVQDHPNCTFKESM